MSTLPRLYVTNALQEGVPVALADGQAHYLARVMRLGGGDRARVFNGRDGEWEVELALAGRVVEAIPASQLRPQPATASVGPQLLFAPLKKTRTDFAVEKATELGASMIRPVATERTQTHRVKTERLVSLAIEASEQTERMDIPLIEEMLPLPKALDDWDRSLPLVFCDEAGEAAPMAEALSSVNADAGGGILIGPEGGFSPAERAELHALDFVHAVTLGPRILRAETAIVAALTIWQTVLGDWR